MRATYQQRRSGERPREELTLFQTFLAIVVVSIVVGVVAYVQ